jgi:RNA polymerase sigma-70 factor (ECF subfamily)
MTHQEFLEAMQHARAGDARAMSALLVASFKPLRAAVQELMDPSLAKSGIEPEDIMQEVYLGAWPQLSRIHCDNFSAFMGWLRQIASHKAVDIQRALLTNKRDVRRQVQLPEIRNDSYARLLDSVLVGYSTPSRGAAREEAFAAMMVHMVQLPTDYRLAIQYRFIDGVSVDEIARRMDRSEAAVYMLLHRGLRQLRELMGSSSLYLIPE